MVIKQPTTVETRDVAKVFGPVVALRQVTLGLEPGRSTVVIGRNGAGKSTLLSILSTAMRPTSGQVLYDGQPAAQTGPALRGMIGHATDQLGCYGDLTGRENVLLQARLQRVSDPPGRTAVILGSLGLEAIADRFARGYSQGETRRLGLARALVHAPKVLLLDEPTAGLDAAGAELLVTKVREHAEGGAIVVVTTHDPWLGARIGQRVIRLKRGVVDVDREGPGTEDGFRSLLGGC